MSIQPFRFLFLLLFVAGIVSGPLVEVASAQERPAETVQITLVDGSQVVGTVEAETSTHIVFRTTSGVRMEIPRDRIERMTPQQADTRRVSDTADPNATRLLFAPTARPIGRGEGYLAVYELFFPFGAVGVGNRVSVAGGFSLIPGVESQLLYAAPKVTVYERRNAAVALGTYFGRVGLLEEETPLFGLVYGNGTFGSERSAVTVGVGYAFAGSDVADRPVIMVGGEHQVGRSVKLLSENYIIPGFAEATVISGGVRFFGDQLSADVGLFTVFEVVTSDDLGGFPFLPWLGFAYQFGR